MKTEITEITEKERKAIEEASIEYANKNADTLFHQQFYTRLFKAGAEFALSEIRKPSNPNTITEGDHYIAIYPDGTTRNWICKNGEKLNGFVWPETDMEVYVKVKAEPAGRTDEELVRKIESVMVCFSKSDGFHYMLEDPYTEVATEIAALLTSSRCQENDVNVELWQLKKIQNALRLTANIHDCKCKVTSWDRQVIEALEFTDEIILNAEKQTKV